MQIIVPHSWWKSKNPSKPREAPRSEGKDADIMIMRRAGLAMAVLLMLCGTQGTRQQRDKPLETAVLSDTVQQASGLRFRPKPPQADLACSTRRQAPIGTNRARALAMRNYNDTRSAVTPGLLHDVQAAGSQSRSSGTPTRCVCGSSCGRHST